MISALLLIDAKGKNIVSRYYREDVKNGLLIR